MITRTGQKVSYSLGLGDHYRDIWLYRDGKWRKYRDASYKEEPWYEDYYQGEVESGDMALCWITNYLPGAKEWDDYGDITIQFDVEEVEDAGWTIERLEKMLGVLANAIKRRRVLEAEPPYTVKYTDSWGRKCTKWRHPAPQPLVGMIPKDYPSDLDIQ